MHTEAPRTATNWDERYSEVGFAYGTAPNEFLVSVADRISHGQILSLAEGEGRNAVYLAALGYEVTGVDVLWSDCVRPGIWQWSGASP